MTDYQLSSVRRIDTRRPVGTPLDEPKVPLSELDRTLVFLDTYLDIMYYATNDESITLGELSIDKITENLAELIVIDNQAAVQLSLLLPLSGLRTTLLSSPVVVAVFTGPHILENIGVLIAKIAHKTSPALPIVISPDDYDDALFLEAIIRLGYTDILQALVLPAFLTYTEAMHLVGVASSVHSVLSVSDVIARVEARDADFFSGKINMQNLMFIFLQSGFTEMIDAYWSRFTNSYDMNMPHIEKPMLRQELTVVADAPLQSLERLVNEDSRFVQWLLDASLYDDVSPRRVDELIALVDQFDPTLDIVSILYGKADSIMGRRRLYLGVFLRATARTSGPIPFRGTSMLTNSLETHLLRDEYFDEILALYKHWKLTVQHISRNFWEEVGNRVLDELITHSFDHALALSILIHVPVVESMSALFASFITIEQFGEALRHRGALPNKAFTSEAITRAIYYHRAADKLHLLLTDQEFTTAYPIVTKTLEDAIAGYNYMRGHDVTAYDDGRERAAYVVFKEIYRRRNTKRSIDQISKCTRQQCPNVAVYQCSGCRAARFCSEACAATVRHECRY